MHTRSTYLWLIAALSFLSALLSNTAIATSPAFPPSVTINSMEIIGEPTEGKTVELKIAYTAYVNGQARFILNYPGYIRPTNLLSGVSLMEETVTLVAGQTAERRISLQVEQSGASLISAGVILSPPLAGYSRGDSRFLSIESTDKSFRIYDDRAPGEPNVKRVVPHYGADNPLKGGGEPMGVNTTYNVSITGKIDYYNQNFEVYQGLYGNYVKLWFRNTANPNEWYHPVYAGDCYGTRHTHYDMLDANGNYNFNFTFNGDLSGYNQVLVLVERGNPASWMPVQQNGIESWCNNAVTVYFSLSEAVQYSINGSNPNIVLTNANAQVNWQDGAIFRNMILAREFVIQRYGGNPPFTTAPIETRRGSINGGLFSVVWSLERGFHWYVTIGHAWTEPTVVTHEYGHYANFNMWGQNVAEWFLSNDNLIEGWGIFYSFAARNYINKVYGDGVFSPSSLTNDNTELGPFYVSGSRYRNISYAYNGEPMKAAIGCYLWNLYDGYAGEGFEMSTYDPGDNDDISGLSNTVFETMRNLDVGQRIAGVPSYHQYFKSNVSSATHLSIDDIYRFMFDDLYNIPAHKMRSPQVKEIGVITLSQVDIRFSWVPQSYPSFYSETNPPNEYRIYKNDGGIWNLVRTAPYGSSSVLVTIANPRGQYRVTSANSSGDSYGAPEVNIVAVVLTPAAYVEPGGSGGTYRVNGNPVGESWQTYAIAGQQMTIEALPPNSEWVFVQWSDGNKDQLRTILASEVSLLALYKKHLASSLAVATSPNSQRKLSVDKGEIDSKAALTYASGGEIWLSESDGSLGTFTNEFRVSDGSGNFNFPSVVATSSIGTPPSPGDGFSSSPPHIAVVYQKTFENGLGVSFREKSGEAWENPATLESYNFGVVNATPVIGRTGCEHFPQFTVVWVRGEGLKYRHRSAGIWNPSPQSVPGSTSGDVRPSISTGYMNYDPNYHGTAPLFLSYDNSTSIFLQRINGGTFQTRETIWQTTGTFAGKSQVAADTRNSSELHAHVVWENLSAIVGPNEEEEEQDDIQLQSSVMHRRKVGNTLGWVTEFRSFDTGEHYYHPTVALLDDGTARWAWDNGMDCFKARWDGSSWEVTDYQPYTAHPTLPGNGTSGLLYSAPFLSMSLSGAPYAIEQRDQSDAVPRIETAYSRRVAGAIAPAKGEPPAATRKRPGFSIELRQVQLKLADGSRVGVEFVQTRSNQTTAWEMMQTRPVMLTAAIESVFVRGIVQLDSAQRLGGSVRISFDLIDNQTGNLLGKLGTERVFTADTVKGFRIKHRIAPFAGREVIIRPAILGLNERDMKFEFVHVHTIRVDTNSMRPILSPTLLKQEPLQGPTEFALHPTYPNPFNPSTTIRYELPEAVHASLVIYDVMGRKVAELVNGTHEAGYYAATWDASGVASGVYFARFTATDMSGGVRLNKVSKLVLTK
ncbi:MAG: T9SS type A sorting domain-containing protein [Bacteroidetes bacterium]|nr:T9SS type A sorting domain-containing protein [Bacteroidota bacterium]MCW5897507.1 T9SS type A sorting domain-containing protein [Bacteroidota bacterium]